MGAREEHERIIQNSIVKQTRRQESSIIVSNCAREDEKYERREVV
jgi:hypothetical protein